MTPNYLVLGAGAVGQGFASFLHRAGGSVTMLARHDLAALRRHGLRRLGVLGEHTTPAGEMPVVGSLADANRPFDAVFICVKSYDSAGVAADLAAHRDVLAPEAPVILCQNGWGNAEAFARRLPAGRLLNARILTGFEREGEGRVRVSGHAGPVRLGSLFHEDVGTAGHAAAMLSAGGLPAEATPEIARDLWDKMCLNCVINPLGAALGLRVGEIAARLSLRPLIEGLVREMFGVMAAYGYRCHSATPGEYLERFHGSLVPAIAAHRPSMWHDLAAGRRTEIDALNGAVVRLGERANCEVRHHRLACALVRRAEAAHAAG
jgi:2-dehydropantoate 2-reductase